MKRLLAFALLVAFALPLLTGCAPEETPDPDQVTLTDQGAAVVCADAASAQAGVITMVGLLMPADGFDGPGISTEQLRGMVHDIKQLKNISVCGCIITGNVEGLHGKALGKYVRSSYQTAKVMTYILPCSMPYICVDGLLEAAAWNEAAHPEDFQDFLTAANIVGMQNTTAFYADYYVI